jgi:hemolysin III
MGWLAIAAIRPIMENLEPAGVWLLIGGGVAYTLGTIFYVLKRVRFMHAVWHLWVLAGSVLHFLAVMLYVFPAP